MRAPGIAVLNLLRDDLEVERNLRDQDDVCPAAEAAYSAIQPV